DGAVEGGLGLRALGGAEEAVGQLAQQGAALGAGRFLRQGDQVGQARAGLGRGGGDGRGGGAVAHGSIGPSVTGSSAMGAARRRPWASRMTAGASGGWARSSEAIG